MNVAPISGMLSTAQIAAVQQTRPVTRAPRQAPAAETDQTQAQNTAQPLATRGRGQIINITV